MKKNMLSILMAGALMLSVGCAKEEDKTEVSEKPVVEEATEETQESTEEKEDAIAGGGETKPSEEEVRLGPDGKPAVGGPKYVDANGNPILGKDGIPLDNHYRMASEQFQLIKDVYYDSIVYPTTPIVYHEDGELFVELLIMHPIDANDMLYVGELIVLTGNLIQAGNDAGISVRTIVHIVEEEVYANSPAIGELSEVIYGERPDLIDTIDIRSSKEYEMTE